MPQYIANQIKSELKQLQNHINDMTALAKSRWYYNLSCKIHDINMNSKVARECIDILKGGDKDDHKKTGNVIMKN